MTLPDQIVYLWLFAGAGFLALEAFGASGLGFFFAGIAALCVSLAIRLGLAPMDDYFMQAVWFLGLTTFWAVLLWKPMKKIWSQQKRGGYSNIVGETAVVGEGGIAKGAEGKVSWSGTIMTAELGPQAGAEHIAAGSRVKIVAVKGAKLIIEPER